LAKTKIAEAKKSAKMSDGTISRTETVTITVDNDTCSYNVRLCVSCPAGTNPVPFEIILNQFEPADSSCEGLI
jgi:hypothetical protein